MIYYSICICNYNMADTIEKSLISLLEQLDDRFEVVIVDDGSTDDSVSIVKRLMERYKKLKLFSLDRDPNRKLGMTRNISIEKAKGEYVILHLDCDDVFGPFIKDFVEVYHNVENAVGHDILLSGQHINMARKKHLLRYGPYLNIYRGEDRNLWSRMGKNKEWIPLDHVDFITRLPKAKAVRFRKNIYDTYDHMKNDFRSGVSLFKYFCYEIKKRKQYSKKLLIFRILMLIPTYMMSVFDKKIPQDDTLGSPELFANYREKTRGTYSEIMKRFGADPSLDFLSSDNAKKIFSNKDF